jgi:hypothetical protein
MKREEVDARVRKLEEKEERIHTYIPAAGSEGAAHPTEEVL